MASFVDFTGHTPRIGYITDSGIIAHEKILIDPKIPPGVPPHYWKLVDGKIEVMNDEEKKASDAIDRQKPKTLSIHLEASKHNSDWTWKTWLVMGSISAAASIATDYLLHFIK